MADGEGRRLRPLTLATPKPLLPYDGKLLLDHAIGSCNDWSDPIMVSITDQVAPKIREYVRNQYDKIECLQETKLLKVGGAIKCHVDRIEQSGIENLVVLMADHMRTGNLAVAVAMHEEHGFDLTLFVSQSSSSNTQHTMD